MNSKPSIPYARQTVDESDVQAVLATLRSDWLTQGPRVPEFEAALAEACGARYAVAVTNGTAALHLAMLALDVQPGHRVLTTPNTFVATSNAILYAGGTPVFADIEPDTFNLDPEQIEAQLHAHPHVRGIIAVHFAGLPADMEAIRLLAQRHGLWVVEDACHALGGSWIDAHGARRRIGDGTYADLTIFSFHPAKAITTAEGGALVTNDRQLAERLRRLRNHGITKAPEAFHRPAHGGWYYEMQDLGFNYRLSDLQAALGLQQLRRNPEWVRRRRTLVQRYDEAFAHLDAIRPQVHPDDQVSALFAYHLYVLQTPRRYHLHERLRERGIYTQVHYIPVHLHPYYRERFGYRPGDFPVAEAYYAQALSLPLYPGLHNEDQDYVIACVQEFIHECDVYCRSGLQS